MSPANKCTEREKWNRAGGYKLSLYLNMISFQSYNHFNRHVLVLTRTCFCPSIQLSAWRWGCKRMKGLCLLPIPKCLKRVCLPLLAMVNSWSHQSYLSIYLVSFIKSANTFLKSRRAYGYSSFSRSKTGTADLKSEYKFWTVAPSWIRDISSSEECTNAGVVMRGPSN